jgi:penicillin-binding protein 2
MLNKTYAGRLKTMLVSLTCILGVLVCRAAYLQIYKGVYYDKQADGNRLRSTRIMAARGLIYDRKGKLVVTNSAGYTLTLQPHRDYAPEMLKILGDVLGISSETITERLKLAADSYEPIKIKSNLTTEEITAIEERRKDLNGVAVELEPERKYIFNELAVHLLGYTGEVSEYDITKGRFKGLPQGSVVGKSGLEETYDKYLRGTDGKRNDEVDASGRVVKKLGSIAPKPGKDLVLTIDLDLQQALEKAVDEQLASLQSSGIAPYAKACAVVAIDPRTGAIRAMVSRPAFNPNLFAKGISNKDWQEINNNPFDPMTNKAISGQYPPGSTFKVVTGSAALDLHKVDPEELIFDSGHHWIIPMGNAGGEALGWINFQTAFAASDNVYFYEMGRRVGIDNLDAYAAKYGFGSTTGVDLPGEEPGLIPSPAAKQKVFGEEWGLGDTFNSAIGQGLTLVTPIQLAQMLSIVANNGVLKQPYLVEKVLNEDGSVLEVPKHKDPVNVGISKETLALIQKGLAGVTQAGGTASYFSNLGIPIAGKTGTAENPHGQDHGLFIAYAPLDNPELVIAAVVEQGSYGSTASGPIVYKLLEAMLKEKD